MENITNSLNHKEDRFSDLKDKVYNLENLAMKTIKGHDQNDQEIWENMKRPNLRIFGIKEGSDIRTKGMHNHFGEIISEMFQNLKNEKGIQIQEIFRIPNR